MSLWQDLRYGARTLRKAPGFTLTAVVTMALGIGATTATFSICDAMLWKPLPLPHLDQLVMVMQRLPDDPNDWVSNTPADAQDIGRCLLRGLRYDAMPMGYALLPLAAAQAAAVWLTANVDAAAGWRSAPWPSMIITSGLISPAAIPLELLNTGGLEAPSGEGLSRSQCTKSP